MNPEEIGKFLRIEAALHDVEHRRLAHAAGVVPSTISQYMAGKRTPDSYTLAALIVEIHREAIGDDMAGALFDAILATRYEEIPKEEGQPTGAVRLRTDETEPERIGPGRYRNPQTSTITEIPSEAVGA